MGGWVHAGGLGEADGHICNDYRPWPVCMELNEWQEKREAAKVVQSGTGNKVNKYEVMGELLRKDATDQNEDWPVYERYLRDCLTLMGQGIHESLNRTCSDFLGVTDGKFAPGKVERWMKAMAVHCLAHNNKAEGPFALVKTLKKLYPNMRLETDASLATCMFNGTYKPGEAEAKTEKTLARQVAAGGPKGPGQGLAAPKPLKDAVRVITKVGGVGAKRRRDEAKQARADQATAETEKVDVKCAEAKRLKQQHAENSNVHKEQTLIESAPALQLALQATSSASESMELLKAQINARISGHSWAYTSLPVEWLHNGKPRLSDKSSRGVDAQVEYLTKVVSRMISIDNQENRYQELANADSAVQLGFEIGDSKSICQQAKRYGELDEAEADALEPEDDPTLVKYEEQFLPGGVGEVFVDVVTAMRGRGRERKEVIVSESFYRVVAVRYSEQNQDVGEVWGLDVVPVDEYGVVPPEHRTCSANQCGPNCTEHVKSRSVEFYGLQDSTTIDNSVAKMVADYEIRFTELAAAAGRVWLCDRFRGRWRGALLVLCHDISALGLWCGRVSQIVVFLD